MAAAVNVMKKTVVADDHDLVRKGLISLLARSGRAEVVGEARDGRELVRVVEEKSPELVVLDISMPVLSGIDAAAHIRKQSPTMALIILSVYADEDYVLRALKAGVNGYVLKDTVTRDIVPALDAISQGNHFISRGITDVLLEDYARQQKQEGLTDEYGLLSATDKKIFQLLAQGATDERIAIDLNLSALTVGEHRSRIMGELSLRNAGEIALCAIRNRIAF
jgi:two-component system response regulator NreC